ncbi:MAG: DHA2 family efflux MFS transporter permease subunit [Planctomycetaceae bacterium]|nr:DHA2 family efflux MFS transporter permease subunit [Planctomycetaceae bacterium]
MESTGAKSKTILLWLVAAAFFMDMLDGTILNTAIPTISGYFGQSPLRMQSVIIAYTLTVALLIPISGWLADRYGTRKIFFLSIILFCAGSLFCAMSPTLEILVLSRIFQGVGGSMMVPVGRLIVLKAFSKRELVRALNFVILPALIGPLMGPTIGGLIVTYTTWHWIFLINLPVGLIVGLAIRPLLSDFREENPQPFDWRGAVLFGASMVCISFALEGFGALHLGMHLILAFLLIGLTLLIVYWCYAFRVKNPLFRPSLFRHRGFTVGIIGGIFARLANGAMPFLTPLLLQVALGFSPIISGLTTIPLFTASLIAKSWSEFVLRRVGHRKILIANTILLGLFIMGFATINENTPYILLLLQLLAFGIVNTTQFTAMNTLVLLSLPREEESPGNSMLSVVIQVSLSLGIATAAAILGSYESFFGIELTAPKHEILKVFHATYLTVGLIGIAATSIFLWTPGAAELKKHVSGIDEEKT